MTEYLLDNQKYVNVLVGCLADTTHRFENMMELPALLADYPIEAVPKRGSYIFLCHASSLRSRFDM